MTTPGLIEPTYLGLGVYAEGSSTSGDSESEERRDESSDSENELKVSIKSLSHASLCTMIHVFYW